MKILLPSHCPVINWSKAIASATTFEKASKSQTNQVSKALQKELLLRPGKAMIGVGSDKN